MDFKYDVCPEICTNMNNALTQFGDEIRVCFRSEREYSDEEWFGAQQLALSKT